MGKVNKQQNSDEEEEEQSALISAVLNNSEYDVCQHLKYNKDVDVRDKDKNTALHLACRRKYRPNLKIISELVMHGANVYLFNNKSETCLDIAFSNIRTLKVIIRVSLLKRYEWYDKIIHLNGYSDHSNYNKAHNYIKECMIEIRKMKQMRFGSRTLLTCLRHNLVISLESQLVMVLQLLTLCNSEFRIYNNFVMDWLTLTIVHVDKKTIVKQLGSIQVYIKQKKKLKHSNGENFLNFDCLSTISKYLSRDDLFNFMIAAFIPSPVEEEKEEEPSRKRKRSSKSRG